MLERFRLDGEVAVTTGGGNGIGRATAAALVEAGAAVALLDRDQKAIKETEGSLSWRGYSHVQFEPLQAAMEKLPDL